MDPRILFSLCAAGSAAAGCAAGGPAARSEAQVAVAGSAAVSAPARCDLRVAFGSFAMGVDRGAAGRIERLLAGHPEVAAIGRSRPGPEGEYALCVATRSPAVAAALSGQLLAAVGKVRAPVMISTGGVEYNAPIVRR